MELGTRDAELAGLRAGQHACLLYEQPDDCDATVAPFLRDGLARGDRCLFVGDGDDVADVVDALRRLDIDVDGAMARGALLVKTAREAFLPDGRFEPARMTDMLAEATHRALADGFAGLRATGEMAWALGPESGCERLFEYEALLNHLFETQPHLLGICRYDLRRFPSALLRDLLHAHPYAVLGEWVCPSTYYEPPAMALGRSTEAERVAWMVDQLKRSRAARLELERAIAARDELIAAAAHELRTPLTTLRLNVDSLSRQLAHGDPVSGSSERIATKLEKTRLATRALEELVERLLDVADFSRGRPALRLEELDAVAVVQAVLDRSAPQAARARCPLVLDAPEAIVGRWDPARLEQLLVGLLANAIKFGAGRPVEVRATGTEEALVLSVRDHGIGIAPANLERIFDRFERAVPLDHYGGLGVGLWIVRAIADAFGGSVTVASELGAGATFTATLPRRPRT